MSVKGNPPRAIEAGEYGATTVLLSTDGGNARLAFGLNGPSGEKVYYGAVLLTPEAIAELKQQMQDLGL